MTRFIARRILLSIPVLASIVFFSFLMVRLQPEGPFNSSAGGNPLPENLRLMMETRYGLHRPFQEQFLIYLGNVLQGDFGPLLRSRYQTANEVIASSLPVSLQLGFSAIILGLLIGVPAGIIAALRHNRPMDYAATFVAVIGISIPNLVLAPVLVLFFGLRLNWLPIAFWGAEAPFTLGVLPPFDLNFIKHAILPVVTLGVAISATIARLVRSSLLEVLSEDYIRTARAKGIQERMVLIRHALKNALIPTVTILGPLFVTLLPGMVIVENIFAINGLARVMVDSVFDSEYFLLSGSILVFAIILVTGNLLADVLYVWLDPRISYRESR
jgi:oligopeptide transport system permease protein